jgi:hypothetical protein
MLLFDTNNQRAPTRLERGPEQTLLQTLQDAVGGYIEEVRHKRGLNAPFMAYCNEDGRSEQLPNNGMAGFVLQKLGFVIMPVFGNVVLMGQDERPLTTEQLAHVDNVVREYVDAGTAQQLETGASPKKKVRKEHMTNDCG